MGAHGDDRLLPPRQSLAHEHTSTRARRIAMGPLDGIKVIELAGIGPGPMCAMLLADLGAEVVRIDRLEAVDLGIENDRQFNLLNRSRRSVAVDLKKPEGVGAVL